MKVQYDNFLMSSFQLWLDHTISDKGSGYYQRLVQFWPDRTLYGGLYAYNSPFSQLVCDSSLPGVTIQTGVHIGDLFVTVGTNGFSGIDYEKGRLYFTGIQTGYMRMESGIVKEIPVVLTNEPETKLLFETKYENKPKTSNTATGIASDSVAYPVLFVRNNSSQNDPFQFGGTVNTTNHVRILAMCDSQMQLDAVTSIIRDQKYEYVPILAESEFPFNAYGFFRNGSYNYSTLTANKVSSGDAAYIEDVFVSKTNQNSYSEALRDINPNVYIGIYDLELSKPRDI